MNWKFWKKESVADTGKAGKLSKPKDPPQAVGRKLVVELKIDPDEAWELRYVKRPSEANPGILDFRLYDPAQASQAGLFVKDWHSLDDHTDLILYEGHHDRSCTDVSVWPRQKPAA